MQPKFANSAVQSTLAATSMVAIVPGILAATGSGNSATQTGVSVASAILSFASSAVSVILVCYNEWVVSNLPSANLYAAIIIGLARLALSVVSSLQVKYHCAPHDPSWLDIFFPEPWAAGIAITVVGWVIFLLAAIGSIVLFMRTGGQDGALPPSDTAPHTMRLVSSSGAEKDHTNIYHKGVDDGHALRAQPLQIRDPGGVRPTSGKNKPCMQQPSNIHSIVEVHRYNTMY
ncbi:hypothetical protein CYLTODRAFT_75115 [Cylindrobasidium torrendii FP15055 ss-10]|uniref:Uncharacterized protein n=1 Tax=Cylindrobasidium torrendii FP15055 ss-10 TaxID=1314674 RepID=A0A0D7B3D3_9AGAR|nr:hypothetical protein CYLTODRAFT_75115 [Cylindrobasidium torrendii FP15055 ss-10]